MPAHHDLDRDDWDRFLGGDGRALERHAMNLAAFQRPDAEDLLQMTIERLLRRGWNPGDVDHPVAYAKKTMENIFLSLRARSSARCEVLAPPDPADQVPATPGRPARLAGADPTGADPAGADPAEKVADRDAVIRALRGLTERRRLILVLRFGEDLAYPQIAERLGCAASTARTEATRALKQLSRQLPDAADNRKPAGEADL